MTEKKVLLKDATEAQLRDFAQNHLGIEISENEKRASILTKIQAAYTKEDITVTDHDGPADKSTEVKQPKAATSAKTQVQRAKTSQKGEKMVRLMIQRTEGPGGADDVPLGCNGKVMLVPRGRIVEIPERYYEVLKNAIKHVYDPLPEGGLNPVPREVPEFPFQVYDQAA